MAVGAGQPCACVAAVHPPIVPPMLIQTGGHHINRFRAEWHLCARPVLSADALVHVCPHSKHATLSRRGGGPFSATKRKERAEPAVCTKCSIQPMVGSATALARSVACAQSPRNMDETHLRTGFTHGWVLHPIGFFKCRHTAERLWWQSHATSNAPHWLSVTVYSRNSWHHHAGEPCSANNRVCVRCRTSRPRASLTGW